MYMLTEYNYFNVKCLSQLNCGNICYSVAAL